MKTSIFTKVEIMPLLISIAVGLFPGDWGLARSIVFFTSLALAIVVGGIHLVRSKAARSKGGTFRKQYLNEFTLNLARDFRDEMSALGDEVGEATNIENIFEEKIQRTYACIQIVCDHERLTAPSGMNSILHLDLLATKRGLEAVEKTLNDEFNDFFPHCYVHPVKRPVRVKECTNNLMQILKTI